MAGYVKLHRQMTEWEWYQDTYVKCLFLHLLLCANYEDKRWRGKMIFRGQLVTSLAHLSDGSGLSIRQIRTALGKLSETGEIITETTNKFTVITICKFDFYQSNEEDVRQSNDNQTTNKRQTNDNQTTTTKEYKEYKEREEDNPHTYAHACVRARDGDEEFFAAMKRGGTQWQEDACRTLKITLPELADLVCQFEVECRAKGTTHISWKDASSHFIDWGRRQVQSRQKQQYYGSRNKENIDKRGGFEPTDNTDYSA